MVETEHAGDLIAGRVGALGRVTLKAVATLSANGATVPGVFRSTLTAEVTLISLKRSSPETLPLVGLDCVITTPLLTVFAVGLMASVPPSPIKAVVSSSSWPVLPSNTAMARSVDASGPVMLPGAENVYTPPLCSIVIPSPAMTWAGNFGETLTRTVGREAITALHLQQAGFRGG
jgi:hypothetical protein